MLVQCTKKLLDKLHIKLDPALAPTMEEDPLYSWHANLITLNRRQTLVLMNDRNRYVIVLYGLKAKDFARLDELILQGIRETFAEECIKTELIEQFIHSAGRITFTKTKNKSLVAKMNKSCDSVHFYIDLLHANAVVQAALGMKVSSYLVGERQNDFFIPREQMYQDLERYFGGPIFQGQAAQLKVTLLLEKLTVWRKLVVPVNITFSRLHRAIQVAFGWQDYHLHDFYVYDQKGLAPIVNLICDEEAFEYEGGVSMKLEQGVKLAEYLPAKIKYTYDFGDNWEHLIEVERLIDDYDKNYPLCLEGEGNAPPEDVGGEWGYEEFLEIIADESHPEYQHMLSWAESQWSGEFNLDEVNWRLKHV